MPIAYPEILSLTSEGQAYAWTEKETMLYALGIGPLTQLMLPTWIVTTEASASP